jgi:hypothetical protein
MSHYRLLVVFQDAMRSVRFQFRGIIVAIGGIQGPQNSWQLVFDTQL